MTTAPALSVLSADTVHSTANFAVRHMVVATFRGASRTSAARSTSPATSPA